METKEKAWRDFGGMPLVAPTAKRVDVLAWAYAGGALGALCGTVALNLLWRPVLGLEAPPGALGEHVMLGLRWAVHQAWAPAFASDAERYADWVGGLNMSSGFALAWRLCVAAGAACAPAVWLAPRMLKPRDGLTVLRGPARFEGAEAVEALRRLLAKRCVARPSHEVAPGVPYPGDMWTRHMLLIGGVGSGKSTALKPLIAKIIASDERALIFDPKGEFTKGFGAPWILAPWDSRSIAWDVARDMRNIGDMRRLAATMVKEAQDPMWSNAARQLLVGFMVFLKETRGDDWGWGELARCSSEPQSTLLPMMERHHPEAARAIERASVTAQGILINLASFMAPIHDLAQAWGEVPRADRVSFVEWTHGRDARAQIILQGHGAYPDLTKSVVEGIIGTVAAIVNSVEMDDDPNRKIWIVADESAQMGKAPIRPLFDVGRSRGASCVLACQDLGQLEEIHGDKTVKAIVSMAGSILLGQLMPGETAEQMCKALGSREVERANVSASMGRGDAARSTTLSFSRDELALYKPAELASRLGLTADGQGVRMALCTGGNAYELFWPHFQMKTARPAHVPAPWTRRFVYDSAPSSRAASLAEPDAMPDAPVDVAERHSASGAGKQSLTALAEVNGEDSVSDGEVDEGAGFVQDKAEMPSNEQIENLLRQF